VNWFYHSVSIDYYGSSPKTNPTGPTVGSYRVRRGGGWNDEVEWCRVFTRDDCIPDSGSGYADLGFRLALSL